MRADDFFAREAAESPAFKAAWDGEAPISVLALNVYRLRKELGITQADLGQRAGLSQPKIAKIESGDANPELRTLGRLAGALGVTVGELLTDVFEEEEEATFLPDVVSQPTPLISRERLGSFAEVAFKSTNLEWSANSANRVNCQTSEESMGQAANDLFALAA